MLKIAIFFPPASTALASPGAISPALATLTKSAIAHLLMIIIAAIPAGGLRYLRQGRLECGLARDVEDGVGIAVVLLQLLDGLYSRQDDIRATPGSRPARLTGG